MRHVLAAAAILTATPAEAADVEAQIRAARAATNAAIAAHDFAPMRHLYLPDYTILPGSSGMPSDLEAYAARLTRTFADPSFVAYVRTPDSIRVSASGKRAAEVGTWVGTWRKPDGEMRLSGVYQATWQPTPEGWRLKNEAFVSLDCRGSVACNEVD